MTENENRDSIQPDSRQNHVTPPAPSEPVHGIEAEDSSAHDAKREADIEKSDVVAAIKQVEWPMIILTAIIALATAANVIVYWCESESAGKQTQKLIDAANIQACAAARFAASASGINQHTDDAVGQFRRLADDTEKNIKNAQATFRDEQRAWVGADNVTNIVIKENEIPSFSVQIKNTGKTPALHLRFVTSGTSQPAGQKINFEYPGLAPGPQIASNFVLQPESTYGLGVGGQPSIAPLKRHQVEVVSSGENWFWVYGKITYEDVSGRTHHTKFCFIIAIDLTNSHPCDTYNEAD